MIIFINKLASSGYIVLLPRTEGGFSPSHSEFGNDLKFLVNAGQNLNTINSPTILSVFNNKVLAKSAIGGHSMGGGSSFLGSANNASVTCIFNFCTCYYQSFIHCVSFFNNCAGTDHIWCY